MADTPLFVAELSAENEALHRELDRYKAIFEQLQLGAYVYQLEDAGDDRSLRMVAANPAVELLAGVKPAELVGKTLDESFPGLREQGLPQAYAGVARSGEPYATEVVYGDERVVSSAFAVRVMPLPHDEIVVCFDNITVRKQVELDLKQLNTALEQRVTERASELEQSQRLLRHVLDASPSAIYIKDLEGRFLLINSRAADIMGRPAHELIGHADHELFPAEYVAHWRAAEGTVLRTRQPYEQEETAPQPDGIHTFLSSRSPLFDEQGEIFAIGGISTDITARIRVEEELRQTREHLQLVVNSMPSSVFWKNLDLTYGGCNQAFARDAGLEDPAEIVGKSDYDMPWGATEAEAYRAYDRKVMEAGQPELHIVETQQTSGGRQIWLDTNKIPLRNQRGEVIGVLGAYEDITERRQTEEALRESQRLLATLFDHLPVGVMLKAAVDGRFILWNSAAEQFFGARAEEVVGKTDHELFPPEVAAGLWAKHQAVLATGKPDLVPEEVIHSPQRGPVTASINRVPIFDAEGRPAYMLIIVTDLSEQKRAADERTALQAQIIEAQQHALRELSTPLLPLSPKVVLMPIVGAMDSRRAQQVIETLLEGVAANNAQLAIVDITGVQVVDTQVANAFIQSARAVQLLGARVMLTGIRPEVAQTLVQLGVDLQGLITRGSLQAGIAEAFAKG